MDGGAWKAAVHGVAKSQTRLSDFTFTIHFPALEKEMATHSSVLAWRIPGTGEPGGLPSMGLHRVRHHWSDLAAAPAEEKKEWTGSAQGLFQAVKLLPVLLWWWTHVIIDLSRPTEYTTRVNPAGKLWTSAIMCQHRFISCNKCTPMGLNVESVGGWLCGRARGTLCTLGSILLWT